MECSWGLCSPPFKSLRFPTAPGVIAPYHILSAGPLRLCTYALNLFMKDDSDGPYCYNGFNISLSHDATI